MAEVLRVRNGHLKWPFFKRNLNKNKKRKHEYKKGKSYEIFGYKIFNVY